MSDDQINLDPGEVIAALRARASQTYADMLDEVARLNVYARTLAAQVAALQTQLDQPRDAWGDDTRQKDIT